MTDSPRSETDPIRPDTDSPRSETDFSMSEKLLGSVSQAFSSGKWVLATESRAQTSTPSSEKERVFGISL